VSQKDEQLFSSDGWMISQKDEQIKWKKETPEKKRK
jgi:hypothetical protein